MGPIARSTALCGRIKSAIIAGSFANAKEVVLYIERFDSDGDATEMFRGAPSCKTVEKLRQVLDEEVAELVYAADGLVTFALDGAFGTWVWS